MSADTLTSSWEPAANPSDKAPSNVPAKPELLCLDASDYLYQEGDLRAHIYRVEHGAIGVYAKQLGRPNQLIEIVGRRDFVGLGCFERYGDSALAIESTLLTRLDEQEFIALAERLPFLKKKQVDAIHRAFERRKAAILNRYPSAPVEALAAFLASVSRLNVHEGRNATIVTDSLKCGAVANLLGFDIETLEKALLDLKNNSLIQEGSNGQVHLLDLEQLEQLADGAVTLSQI
jgi:CRP/FNR family transcriptional regulator, anaerobic regulatory protein